MPPSPRTQPGVTLDLDALERDEPEQQHEPFVATVAGHPYAFRNPDDVAWTAVTNAAHDPQAFLLAGLANEAQRAAFAGAIAGVPVWKVTKLVEAWHGHFGITPSAAAVAAVAGSAPSTQ